MNYPGGPSGASWNAFELRCSAVLHTPCREGAVIFRVAGKVIAQLPLEYVSTQTCSFPLPYEVVSELFDEPASGDAEAIYASAMLRAEVVQFCGDAPYPSVDRDAFVGGFSGGE